MNLLFDQNISFRISNKLQDHFANCRHISACGLQDCEDSEIWSYARKNDYAIVTFDADFYDISLINGHPPKIIWIRTGNLMTSELVKLLISNKLKIYNFLNNPDFKEQACLEIEE